MSKTELPDPLTKREMLHSDKPVDSKEFGDKFFEAGRYNDAIDFYAKGELKDGLLKVKRVALEEGDFFLLKRLKRLIPDEVSEEDWSYGGARGDLGALGQVARSVDDRLGD